MGYKFKTLEDVKNEMADYLQQLVEQDVLESFTWNNKKGYYDAYKFDEDLNTHHVIYPIELI